MTRASRDTTTGLWFEEQIHINNKGIDLTKNKLYTYLKSRGIDYTTIISRKLLPDEAYYNPETGILDIYEKNISRQQVVQMKNLKRAVSKFFNSIKQEKLSGQKK